MNDEKDKKSSAIEGEGSYTATHNYNDGVKKSVEAGKTEELAEKAKKALDGKEGASLKEAEQEAKKHAKG
ncbi:hypothetical protein BH09MYX1_BH09MYX1_00160 [soil metagenome]